LIEARSKWLVRWHAIASVCLIFAGWQTAANAETSPVGKKVSPFVLKDYRGKVYTSEAFDQKILVVAFLGTECPLARLYGPRLARLADAYEAQGVGIVGMNANSQDSITEIAAYARKHEIKFPILKDLGNRVADQMGAIRTPEVFVLDEERIIRYWGRIDDQYGVGYAREKPHRNDLRIAIDELLAGKAVNQPSIESVGCHIGRVRQPKENAKVTYSRQVSRILQKRCVECHRNGQIAPFALTEFDEVVGWAEMIEEVVREQRMPPWHASAKYGSFVNDRHMTDKEKQIIYDWVADGAPPGDPSELPAPRSWPQQWQLPRKPDFVAPITERPFRVSAEGTIEYQYFKLDPEFEEDKWVSAVEIQPGNRAVVHHVLMFAGNEDEIGERFGGGARGYDGIYVPGQRVQPLPPGMARRIAAGSQLFFQVHYTPIGTEQFDQSRVGMTFVDSKDVQFEVRTESGANADFQIPPNESNHRVEGASPRMGVEARLLALNPHMHLRGKSFFYEAVFPNGEREPLLDVPRYDFNWQTAYRLTEPKTLPVGTRIHCVAHFDNSEDNLNNPDPTKRVRWGPQTWDEMMIGYFDYAIPRNPDPIDTKADRLQRRAQDLFDTLDKNVDGKVTREETPRRHRLIFDRLDRDEDGSLTVDELSKAFSPQN